MMKTLVTAFEPFGSDSFNNSLDILNKISIQCIKEILPVSYPDASVKVKKLIKEYQPDIIIHLGMAKSRKTLTIEQMAVNKLTFSIPDNNGNLLNQAIFENELDYIKNKIDFNNICNDPLFQDRLYLSNDAGTYICNYVYYTSLFNYPDKYVSFIHIPCLNNECDFEFCLKTIEDFINYMKGNF